MTFRTLPPLKYNSYTCKASLSCCTNTQCQMHTPTTPFKHFMKTGHTIPLVGISREIKAYIAKDSYRSWVLQFSASLVLNLIISGHLLLQMKLSISSSVEGKKKTKKKTQQTKKIPNWKIIQKQGWKIWGLSWNIWAHADCSWTNSKLLERHRRILITRSFPFQRKEKIPGFCTTKLLSCIIIQHHEQTQSMLIEDAQLLVPTLKISTI